MKEDYKMNLDKEIANARRNAVRNKNIDKAISMVTFDEVMDRIQHDLLNSRQKHDDTNNNDKYYNDSAIKKVDFQDLVGRDGRDFVNNLYKKILLREPSEEEIESTLALMSERGLTKSDIIFSTFNGEGLQKGVAIVGSDIKIVNVRMLLLPDGELFVRNLFIWILGREADEKGLEDYLTALESGVSKEEVLYKISHSYEATIREIKEIELTPSYIAYCEKTENYKSGGIIKRVLRKIKKVLSKKNEPQNNTINNTVYSSKTTFIIMHESVDSHDAIGTDIGAMYNIIKRKYNCEIYAEKQFNKSFNYIDEMQLIEYLACPDNVVIYHHSQYWKRGYEFLKNAKAKIIFRYHNITPPDFYKNYYEDAYHSCQQGLDQTIQFVKEFPNAYWLSDSKYNLREIELQYSGNFFVCPPFNTIYQWDNTTPNEVLLKGLTESATINALFVGRIVPNKGHKYLFQVIKEFCDNYKEKIHLYIVGKPVSPDDKYYLELKDEIKRLNLENVVEFREEVNSRTLLSFYLGCDVYVCCSEHEGFCVPIVEAQHFSLPIVSLSSSAIPETAGENQLVLEKDASLLAAAIHTVATNRDVREFLREQGQNNYEERFTPEKIEKTFIEIVKEMVGIDL